MVILTETIDMEFNEKLAEQIAKAQTLSLSTVKTWKYREKIPDGWIGGEKPIPLSKKQKELQVTVSNI